MSFATFNAEFTGRNGHGVNFIRCLSKSQLPSVVSIGLTIELREQLSAGHRRRAELATEVLWCEIVKT